ncbi:MAG: cation:proton antiporter [Candidatus ainarchaeum sp.]|nr:cation:proton antiporter [Candidatus ainarchaeum sp.]
MFEVFFEIALIIGIATLVGLIMQKLKQPLLIGYIFTGIIIGILNILTDIETIKIFSEIGIALLLFVVGLHLNPKIIKEVGKVSLITGLGQVVFTSVIGFLISKILGFSTVISIYIAIALTFSSTIIIMKLLSDRGDTNRLYGKISIGFLIVQDILAVLILMVVSSIAGSQGTNITFEIIKTVLIGILLVVIFFLIGLYVLPRFTKFLAKSQELLILFSISWVLILSAIFYYFDFSIEVGAFLAGMTLSMSPYRHEISSRMRPIRDFFIVIFFILLGYQMNFSSVGLYIIPIILLSLFILIGNPLIVIILMGKLGYSRRNGFLAGLTVAQISEFSLILVALGVTVGHVDTTILSLVTAVGLITMAGSSYMIIYADKIFPYISKYLKIFEKQGKKVDDASYNQDKPHDVIVFGYDRVGHDLLKHFKRNNINFLIVDYDPLTIQKLTRRRIPCIYGDVTNMELLDDLNLKNTKMVISIISSYESNIMFINKIKEINKDLIIIVTSNNVEHTFSLYKEGATHVIMPDLLGGEHISSMIEKHGFNKKKFLEEKFKQISSFENREDLHFEDV